MLWFVLAGMAAFAVLAALWPLLRAVVERESGRRRERSGVL